MCRWAIFSILAFGLLAHGSGQQAAPATQPPIPGAFQDPPGCLQATAHTNGPCRLTYPNGMSIATLADGSTWVDMHGDYRFQVFKESGTFTGKFVDTVIIRTPQAPDIIQADQYEKLRIYGACSDNTYIIWAILFTDANGYFTIDGGGPENVARRVMPGTPMETVFKFACISSLVAHEHGFKQSGFQTYTNNRYGFRVDYPLTFVPQPPPENGDGLSFKSQDGKATLVVSGANNPGFTLKDEFHRAIKNVQGQLGYNKTGGSWFVVTWTDGDSIGYTKEFVGPSSQNSFTITFPVEQKSQYDSVVTAIEKSFQPGDLDNSH